MTTLIDEKFRQEYYEKYGTGHPPLPPISNVNRNKIIPASEARNIADEINDVSTYLDLARIFINNKINTVSKKGYKSTKIPIVYSTITFEHEFCSSDIPGYTNLKSSEKGYVFKKIFKELEDLKYTLKITRDKIYLNNTEYEETIYLIISWEKR